MVDITRPWNPDTDIKHVFNHGALCREIATEGGNPISDTSYVLILVKIFRASGVFPLEIREWSRIPETDKTVTKCIEFFMEAYENRLEETLQGALAAHAVHHVQPTPAATARLDPGAFTGGGKWGYCWTHGLCQHTGTECKSTAPHHKHEATLDNPMGGSNEIRFPGQRRAMGKQRRTGRSPTSQATAATATSTQLSSLTDE